MTLLLLLARVLLAVVFLVAGLTKLADLSGSRQALRDFGMPAWFAAPGGLLLPLAELAVAAALLPLASAWWGAVGALILLLAFVVGIASNLARGRQPNCHCFGQVYSKPIGWATLLRNLVLAAVAGFFIAFGRNTPGLSAFAWLAALTLTERIALVGGLLLLALLIGEGWLLLEMLRQQGRLLLRLEALEGHLAAGETEGAVVPAETQAAPPAGLPVGSVAPAFALSGLSGETLTLENLRAGGKPVLLLFSDPGCGPCSALLPEVGRWQHDYAGKLSVALISRGSVEANCAKASEHGVRGVLLQQDRETASAYQASGTPSAALVRPDGTIGSPLAQGADAIRALVAGAVGLPVLHSVPAPAPLNGHGHDNGALPVVKPGVLAPASQIGMPAPAFSLPDLSGQTIALSDFRGRPTLLLFWRPSCGFCQRMLADLKAWEASPPQGAPATLALAGVQVPAPGNDNGNATVPRVPATPPIGEPAPAFSLPNLSGKRVHLSDFRGSPTLLLFWDPGCSFCQRMLADLKAWEAHPPKGAPKLLLVSTGSVETNRALGLRSTIVLDQNMRVGSTFGANGTPMAVLVDAEGKLASALAAGAPAVLALAGAHTAQSASRSV